MGGGRYRENEIDRITENNSVVGSICSPTPRGVVEIGQGKEEDSEITLYYGVEYFLPATTRLPIAAQFLPSCCQLVSPSLLLLQPCVVLARVPLVHALIHPGFYSS